MMIKKKMKSSRIIKILIALIIIPSIFIIWFNVQNVVDKMESSAVHTTQNLLDKLADNLEFSMANDENIINQFAKEIRIDNVDEIDDQLKNLTQSFNFLNAYFVDMNNNVYDVDGRLFEYDVTLLEETAISKGESGFCDAYNGFYGLWETVYQVPVIRNERVVGAVYVQIELNKYAEKNSMSFYGESGMAYLFDIESKNIVLMPPTPNFMMAYTQQVNAVFEELGFSAEQMKNEVYPAIERQEKLVMQGKLQGERVYLSLVSLPNHESWYLCGIVSASEIQQEATLILQILTMILVLLLVVMFMIILLIILELKHRNKVKMIHIREVEMQNAIYDTIADASDSVLCIFNQSTQRCDFVFSNIERILGMKVDAFKKDNTLLQQLLDAADKQLYDRLLNAKIHGSESYQIGYLHPVHHEIRELRITIKSLVIQDVESYLLMMEDITQDIRIQESLQSALENATQANEAKSEFLSHMSHEIRTPINAIIGMREIAEHHLNDENKIKDCLTKIAQSSRHLLELVNDILDLSKIESGKLSLHQQEFTLSDCLSDVFNIIKTQAEAKKQSFTFETEDILHDQLIGDEVRVKQILINLLNNAVKYTQKEGSISLQIKEVVFPHKDYSNYIFTIHDNGVGMSKEFIDHIGKPFEQENNVFHKSESGTGLGLSIVKNVIAIMGGYMHVESELGKGTTIKVELSLKRNNNIAYEFSDKISKLKVLVIDDDEQVLQDVSRCLNEFKVKCDVANSAKKGFALLQEAKEMNAMYDVAIIDWKMPEENGVELTRRIRSHISRDLPVIFISAYDWSDIEYEAKEAGVNEFIEKPLFTKRLYDALTRIDNVPTMTSQDGLMQLQNKRILIVEDNEINREIAVELLGMKGILTETAVNGEEAVQMFTDSKLFYYDLILMDLQMPVMNGIEATKVIRQLNREDAQDVPIVAMTANAFAEDISKCLEVGMNAHLAKPIEIDAMYECIAHQLQERMDKDEK